MSEVKPRRKSIFGGLLWITLGSLLLANNLGARFGFWEFLGNWWPLILILLGLGKLMEHYAATRSGDAPARLLSGGEIFLLILLFLAAGAYQGFIQVSKDNDFDMDFPWWSSYSYTEEISKTAKPNPRIVVNIPRGDVTVHPEEGTSIRVVVNKSIRATDEAEGQELTKDYGAVMEETGGVFEIRPKQGAALKRRVRLDLELHVPRQSQIDIRTERGGVIVNGLTGSVITNTRGGNVEVRDVTGTVDAEMRGGDIRVTNTTGDVKVSGRGSDIEISDVTGSASVTGEYSGSTRIKNVAKEARFNSRRTDVILGALKGSLELGGSRMEVFDVGSVSINTSSYDVTIENPSGRVSVDNKNGDVEVRYAQPPKEEVNINSEKGGVEVMLPVKSEFTIDAASRDGRAESDITQGLRVSETDREARIEGQVGTRGPIIKIRTTHGTIKLREGSRAVETQKKVD